MAVIPREGQVVSGSEIHFLNRDEESYPQLTRLYLDFDFRVLSIASAHPETEAQYLITYSGHYGGQSTVVTPVFTSLPDLERYTDENIIDILHDTLFAGAEER